MPTKLLNSTKDHSFGITYIYGLAIICLSVQKILVEHLLNTKHLSSAGNTMVKKIKSLSYVVVRERKTNQIINNKNSSHL